MSDTSDQPARDAVPPDVSTFVDYRAYLAALVEFARATEPAFSFRGFARKAGFASPNYLQQVIKRHRNLAPASVAAFAKGFGLKRADARIFQYMVEFDAARTDEERNLWCERLLDNEARRREHRQVAAGRIWYPLVIREMAALPGFSADPAWVSTHLRPMITEVQARRALELLFGSGLLVTLPDGTVAAGPAPSLGAPLDGLNLRNAERARRELAADVLTHGVADVSTMNLRLSPRSVATAREELAALELRLRALALEDGSGEGTEIFEVAVALFPVTGVSSK